MKADLIIQWLLLFVSVPVFCYLVASFIMWDFPSVPLFTEGGRALLLLWVFVSWLSVFFSYHQDCEFERRMVRRLDDERKHR